MQSKELILCAEDSPAKTLALQERGEDLQENGRGYGLSTSAAFAELTPDGYWLKMYQGCYQQMMDGQWERFSETWPRAGMMRNGSAFLLPVLVPLTYETEYSYLPTPDASLGGFDANSSADVPVWFQKETTGKRKSGAAIGSSLRWCRDFIQEYLRTGGELNPEWIEVLMGYPTGWSAARD